jgi:hydrogenase nickel incorporation protein HypA/HybF
MALVHEFSIAQAMAAQVQAHAPARARIREVEVRIGALRGLEPEALEMSWEAVTFGTSMAGAVLKLDLLPWTVRCSDCGREWTSPVPFVTCTCGNETPSPVGTDELDLMAITFDEDEADET